MNKELWLLVFVVGAVIIGTLTSPSFWKIVAGRKNVSIVTGQNLFILTGKIFGNDANIVNEKLFEFVKIKIMYQTKSSLFIVPCVALLYKM